MLNLDWSPNKTCCRRFSVQFVGNLAHFSLFSWKTQPIPKEKLQKTWITIGLSVTTWISAEVIWISKSLVQKHRLMGWKHRSCLPQLQERAMVKPCSKCVDHKSQTRCWNLPKAEWLFWWGWFYNLSQWSSTQTFKLGFCL